MEFGEIVVKDTPGLCRCCLSEGCYKDLGTEYPWMEDTEVYAHMLLECFDVSISQHIEGPNGPNRLICEVCITRLRDACNFKKQVLYSEKKFIDMVGRGAFKPKVLMYPEQMKSETHEVPVEEAEIEYLEEEVDYDDIPLNELAEPSVSEDITVATLPVATKRGRPKKTVKTEKKKKLEDKVKPKSSKGVIRIRKEDKLKIKALTNSESDEDLSLKVVRITNETLKITRNNVTQVVINSTVMPFRWLRSSYRCFYCYEVFKEPNDLKSHQAVHDTKDEIRHAIENFWEPEVYVDISKMSCKICPESITDLFQLVNHLTLQHKVEFNKDVGLGMIAYKLEDISVSCVICDQRFRTFSHLLVHSNRDHKGWSEVLCDICGQHFRSAKYLRQHIRTVHSNESVICGLCGLKIFSKNKLRTHMQNVHNHKYSCFKCSEQFETHYKRSQHMMLVHKSRELVKCSWCSRTFVYRSTMMRHVRETHLQERTFSCSICGWRCFSQHGLQKHMLKHSNDRNYKCPSCEKTFKTRKTMRQHVINIHQKNTIVNVHQVENK